LLALGLKIFYILFKLKFVGKHGRDVRGCCKGLHKLLFETTRTTKKDVMDATNVNVSIGENEISYFSINESGNDFMANLYDHGLVSNYIFN
jgi:hypothetical protein